MSVSVRAYEHGAGAAIMRAALAAAGGGGGGAAAVDADDNVDYEGHAATVVTVVGDRIDTSGSDVFLKGHGTQVLNEHLVATQCGAITRTDKLISVAPPRSRYAARAGDVVVGRVADVAGRRWKVDLQSQQEASLLLTAVSLPGGAQRRRNADDELAMRSVLREGDLLSAEVQQVYHDGGVHLHTRSLKFGKLAGGQLVVVPAGLVKRQRTHFVSFDGIGVDAVLGVNGAVWVAPRADAAAAAGAGGDGSGGSGNGGATFSSSGAGSIADGGGGGGGGGGGNGGTAPMPTRAARERAVRVAAAVRALAALHIQVYPATIMAAYNLSLEKGVPPKDMAQPEFLRLLAAAEAERRRAEAAADAGGGLG